MKGCHAINIQIHPYFGVRKRVQLAVAELINTSESLNYVPRAKQRSQSVEHVCATRDFRRIFHVNYTLFSMKHKLTYVENILSRLFIFLKLARARYKVSSKPSRRNG